MNRRQVVTCCALLLITLVAQARGQSNADSEAFDVLDRNVHALYSEDKAIQGDASNALIAAGQRSLPFLLPIICNPDARGFDEVWASVANILGEIKARRAVPCLARLLLHDAPLAFGSPMSWSVERLLSVDPAARALLKMGDTGVPAILATLRSLNLDQAISATRILRKIGTPTAREAVKAYVDELQTQLDRAKEELKKFDSPSETNDATPRAPHPGL